MGSAKLRRAKKKGIKREKRKLGKKLHADEKKIASLRSRMSRLKNKKGKAYKEMAHKMRALKSKAHRGVKRGMRREKRKLGKKLHVMRRRSLLSVHACLD